MDSPQVFLDIHLGDQSAHDVHYSAYTRTSTLLSENCNVYGLPSTPEDLSDEQRDILEDLNKDGKPLQFTKPAPLLAGRITFALDPAPGLAKTRNNYLALCKGDKGMCKNAPNKALHYLNCPLHRIVKGFIAQGGDVTRGDGSGGESIYGGKFNDEKDGLKKAVKRGSLGMANSRKNSNTSQFFIVLADDAASLAKLKGKYVIFGDAVSGLDVLSKIDVIGGADGKPSEKVWIGGCGVL